MSVLKEPMSFSLMSDRNFVGEFRASSSGGRTSNIEVFFCFCLIGILGCLGGGDVLRGAFITANSNYGP